MKQLLLLTLALTFFSGCMNKTGVSATYYRNCQEYYDYEGYYHKDCDPNMFEYEDVKKALLPKKKEGPPPKVQ